MREIGDWLKVVGEGIYGTRPWKTVAEGIDVDQLRTAAADPKRSGEIKASWKFQTLEAGKGEAIRFTRSKDFSSLYALEGVSKVALASPGCKAPWLCRPASTIKTDIACFGLRALGLFARARADDLLLKHPLSHRRTRKRQSNHKDTP